MYFTAIRRFLWSRLGDPRKPARPSPEVAKCIQQTYGEEVKFTAEGGAFGYPGWIVQTSSEVGFVSSRGRQSRIRAVPFDALLETRIQRMALYDYVHLVTRSERVSLRMFRANRDMAQELFNQIQAVMSKRASGAGQAPLLSRRDSVPTSVKA
jgi:hypothetical protein